MPISFPTTVFLEALVNPKHLCDMFTFPKLTVEKSATSVNPLESIINFC